MAILILLTFIIGYLAIVFEHPLKLDKSVPSLLMGTISWALLSIGFHNGSLDIIDSHNHIFSTVNGHGERHQMASQILCYIILVKSQRFWCFLLEL